VNFGNIEAMAGFSAPCRLLIYLIRAVERTTDAAILLAARIVPVAPRRASFETRNSGSPAIGAGLLAYAADGDPIGAGLLHAADSDQMPCSVPNTMNKC
jgi:hypothetical protein